MGQEIHLELDTYPALTTAQLDSLGFRSAFENYKALEEAIDSLSIRLQHYGFLEVRKRSITKVNDTTYTTHFELGNRWKYISLVFDEKEFSPDEFRKLGWKPEGTTVVLPLAQLERVLKKLSRLKSASGTPFASIQLTELKQLDSNFLIAKLELNAREQRTIDGWVIKGYEKFPVAFLRYYAGVKRGQLFRKEKLLKQNEVLDQLGFVKSIKAPEALFKKDSTLVYFYLEKTNHNLFDGILGFATNEETQKLEFNGYLNLELNNNLNFGEQLKINYKADGREQQNFSAAVQLPYLLKTPFGVGLELKIFKRDSTFSTTEQQARVYYQTSPQTRVYAGYKGYESSNLLDSENALASIEDFNANFFLVGGEFRVPQPNRFFPVKSYLRIESEIGKRSTRSNEVDQLRLALNAHHIFNLNSQNSIFIGNSTGYLQSDGYFENDLFRFGGINSLRGFNENSIDASLYTVINSEYRYQFSQALYVNSLLDFGYFENEVFDQQEELYSFGFGLGLNTRSGILKLNIANGFAKNQNLDFGQTKVHLLFVTNF